MTSPPTGKHESYSVAASLAAAIVAFAITLITSSFLAAGVVASVLAAIPSMKGSGFFLLVGTFGIPLFLACCESRWAYMALRWDDDQPSCSSCGYNLTGNVSGTCPECGAAIGQGAGAT